MRPSPSRAKRFARSSALSSDFTQLHDPGRRLVQAQPVELELLHGPDELLEVHRLAHVAVGAQTVAVEHVLQLLRRGQDDNGQEAGTLAGPQAPQDLQPIYLGQLEV